MRGWVESRWLVLLAYALVVAMAAATLVVTEQRSHPEPAPARDAEERTAT